MKETKNIIIGAGPAGLGCAYELTKHNQLSQVIDMFSQPGGLCRTIDFNGYLFDIGGHRFLTKSNEIKDLWMEIMDKDLLHVRRLSRIYYAGKYFNYPLNFFDTVIKLGPVTSLMCFASYLKAKLLPFAARDSFEGWIIHAFGQRLYDIFFKTYTEKVWAVPCKDISSDWAMQRIKGLSLRVAVKNMFKIEGKTKPKTLAEEFLYPRTGPGEIYKRLENDLEKKGVTFSFGKKVIKVKCHDDKARNIVIYNPIDKTSEEKSVEQLFTSMPLPELVQMIDPLPPKEILDAASRLNFRHFLVVNVILDEKDVFSDQWVYVHSPEVRMGRIQNYKNWSPAMVADTKKTSLGLEYFCNKDDDLWGMNDVDLVNYALSELDKLNIASRRNFINGFVVRYKNAYPIYSMGYKKDVDMIKNYLSRFSNIQTIGRAGLFRYDNSDHALLTGIYSARNFLGISSDNIWGIADSKQYLES